MIPINCLTCINYLGNLVCSAFPKGIPKIILEGENMHTEPLKEQDNNIVYEEIK